MGRSGFDPGECKIKDGKLGIHMTMSAEGRPSGEAYVEFDSEEDIENALKKDLQRMGHRYIEGIVGIYLETSFLSILQLRSYLLKVIGNYSG
uniref:RRM domain-containing protein n=1 Tax=Timema bartmani TaxID=61472 RepID=A0A7R9ET76_9NEOP|nr:unnamed protein product [Timema bartmani]